MSRKQTSEEMLRYTFTAIELADLSGRLALACQDRYTAEEEKKAAMAGFKKRIDDASANVAHMSRLVNSGWEMRGTKCRIDYNTPVDGTKRFVRLDTGETVKEIVMDSSEFQDLLPYQDPDADKKLLKLMEQEKLTKSIKAFMDPNYHPEPTDETPSDEPIDVSEVSAWTSGDFIIAAVDAESATELAKSLNLPTLLAFAWSDPDRLHFSGFDELYGDERRSARAAIMHLHEIGRTFPTLLSLPSALAEKAGEVEEVEPEPLPQSLDSEGNDEGADEDHGADEDGEEDSTEDQPDGEGETDDDIPW